MVLLGARRSRTPGRRRRAVLSGALVALIGAASACGGAPDSGKTPPAPTGFVSASGRDLVLDGRTTRLKAVNFSNYYDLGLDARELAGSEHHTGADFARVEELGFNSIRFLVRGDWYLQDEAAFWSWLDRNVGWAREHGVGLILDLHVHIGGRWLDDDGETDFRVWTDPEVQQANVDLWRAMAGRYGDEPAVVAYDLMNEPVTTDGTGEQWRQLSQRMIDAIREVDRNHLVIVSGVYGTQGRFDPSGRQRQFPVDDDNVMYDLHFYDPYAYTHQYAPWVDPDRDGGRYPDPDRLIATAEPHLLSSVEVVTDSLPEGSTDWTAFDSGPVPLDDGTARAALPQFVVEGGMTGTVQFDDVVVTEYAPDGTDPRRVVADPLRSAGLESWYPWGDRDGTDPGVRLDRETAGKDDDGSLSIEGSVETGAGWNNEDHLFPVVPGRQYRVQGYMRGTDVRFADSERSRGRIELAVHGERPEAPGGGFLPRDRELLAYELDLGLAFGAEHDVPMSVMEFGTGRRTFQDGKGGEHWVADVLGLLGERGASFGYWEYHDPEMGLYLDRDEPPETPNSALIHVLRTELPAED